MNTNSEKQKRRKEKKCYSSPTAETVNLHAEDVIATSDVLPWDPVNASKTYEL